LIYLNVTTLPVVNTLMVVIDIIMYKIIDIKKIKKNEVLLVSFPPSLSYM